MQRPVHSSYGRVKQNVCLFVWTGKTKSFFNPYALRSPVRRTAQSAFRRHVIVMIFLLYTHTWVFHEHQRDICRHRTYSQGFAMAVHMSNDRQHFDPA